MPFVQAGGGRKGLRKKVELADDDLDVSSVCGLVWWICSLLVKKGDVQSLAGPLAVAVAGTWQLLHLAYCIVEKVSIKLGRRNPWNSMLAFPST
jgi:hypothetical protein